MKLVDVDAGDARAVLRGLRGAILGAGPAISLGVRTRSDTRGDTRDARSDTRSAADTRDAADTRNTGDARDAAGGGGGDLPPEVAPGTAVVVTTSGSTGYPKSVVLSRSALTASALATADLLGDGAWLLALPPGYIAGVQVLVRSLVAGREPAILSGTFSAAGFAAAASSMASSDGGRRVPIFTSLVPAQLQTLLDDPAATRALASFEAVLVGGQALAPPLAARAADARVRVVRTYGSSETAGGCVYDGTPLAGVRVRIADAEVQLSGPTLADGYLGDPARTDAAFIRDPDGTRWYRTGDTGEFDGRLRITGRTDNVLVSGGINVSLDRVERAVRSIPGLADAVVVAVPDERWGEASVVVTAGTADLERVRAVVAAEVAPHARPRAVLRLDPLPLLFSGKPDRAAIRAAAVRL